MATIITGTTQTIGLNSFVLRQTPESKYSHFSGSFEELEKLVAEHFCNAIPGKRDGIVLVPVPAEEFFSGVVSVTPTTRLQTKFEARQEIEDGYMQTIALGSEKLSATVVEIVVYGRATLLEEGKDAVSTECDWEIVSILARPTIDPEPMTPVAMARNFFGLPGGTKTTYTAEEFASAILYWSKHAMCG